MKKKIKDLQRGEIIKDTLQNVTGHEQRGYRPLLVVSDQTFNEINGYAIVCPLSNQHYKVPDGIPVNTQRSVISGYVLTQHLIHHYEDINGTPVTVYDEATNETVENCLEVFKSIALITDYQYSGINQGEIVEVDFVNGQKILAAVLSENSFNSDHNSIWVSPIICEEIEDGQIDHVHLTNSLLFDKKFGVAYIEATRNIDPQARNVLRTGHKVTQQELEDCLEILNVFFD